MKKEWVKPEIKFITDPDVVLECIYDVYGQEKQAVLSGKNIRHTMIYPFLRMVGHLYEQHQPETVHKNLWSIYQKFPEKEDFVRQGMCYLQEGENCYGGKSVSGQECEGAVSVGDKAEI